MTFNQNFIREIRENELALFISNYSLTSSKFGSFLKSLELCRTIRSSDFVASFLTLK